MQYKKLTNQQRQTKRFRMRRNKLVGELLAKDPRLTREGALAKAYEMLDGKRSPRTRAPQRQDRPCFICRRPTPDGAWLRSRFICPKCREDCR